MRNEEHTPSAEASERKPRSGAGPAKKSRKLAAARPPAGTKRMRVRKPSRDAIEYCQQEFGVRRVDAPIRHSLARRAPKADASILRRLIAGGGEVRLKLYLTALWWAVAEPYEIRSVPASAWARAFGLDRYSTAGAKRILHGVTWLTDEGLLEAERRKGAAPLLRLLREDGSGDDYTRPWVGHPVDSDDRPQIPPEDHYFQVPKELWTEGWISVLTGRALMCLCIHLDATWGREGPGRTKRKSADADDRPKTLRWFHYPERERDGTWSVSKDTWRRGNHELVAWGLVDRRSRWSRGFTTQRQYYEYRVDLDRFNESPLEVDLNVVPIRFREGGGASKVAKSC